MILVLFLILFHLLLLMPLDNILNHLYFLRQNQPLNHQLYRHILCIPFLVVLNKLCFLVYVPYHYLLFYLKDNFLILYQLCNIYNLLLIDFYLLHQIFLLYISNSFLKKPIYSYLQYGYL